MHNSPITTRDYRKLMIDVEVQDVVPGCEFVGIRNAWLEKTESCEVPFYVNRKESKLSYTPDDTLVGTNTQQPVPVGILYNVLLEFDSCEALGDLNDNSIEGEPHGSEQRS